MPNQLLRALLAALFLSLLPHHPLLADTFVQMHCPETWAEVEATVTEDTFRAPLLVDGSGAHSIDVGVEFFMRPDWSGEWCLASSAECFTTSERLDLGASVVADTLFVTFDPGLVEPAMAKITLSVRPAGDSSQETVCTFALCWATPVVQESWGKLKREYH